MRFLAPILFILLLFNKCFCQKKSRPSGSSEQGTTMVLYRDSGYFILASDSRTTLQDKEGNLISRYTTCKLYSTGKVAFGMAGHVGYQSFNTPKLYWDIISRKNFSFPDSLKSAVSEVADSISLESERFPYHQKVTGEISPVMDIFTVGMNSDTLFAILASVVYFKEEPHIRYSITDASRFPIAVAGKGDRIRSYVDSDEFKFDKSNISPLAIIRKMVGLQFDDPSQEVGPPVSCLSVSSLGIVWIDNPLGCTNNPPSH